ncbi:MAG TPA: hypothetical protein VH867_04015 [Burkholderiales bacterium]
MIKSESLDFGEVIEDTTNKLLLMNVLRARDKAPLHFSDIPVIRESLQQTGSLGFLSLLNNAPPSTTLRDSRSGSLTFQMTPSFDINHLHSKEFITGIASPIDPKIVKYWLDRGLDRRLVLLLFFSAVEIVETRSAAGPISTIRIANSPREAADIIKKRGTPFGGPQELRCDTQSDFERYLKLLNRLKTFFANTYKERRLVVGGLSLAGDKDGNSVRAIAQLDLTKMQVVHDRERATYSLYSLSNEQKVAFCFYDDAQSSGSSAVQYQIIESGPASGIDKRNCFQSVVDIGTDDAGLRAIIPSPVFFSGPAAVNEVSRYCGIFNRFSGIGPSPSAPPGGYPRLELRLYIRSVGEIFQFLGDLLYYQDEIRKYLDDNPQLSLKLNSPVTFGYCGDQPEAGCDDVFLRLDGDPCNARFSLTYRDKEYHVANFSPPREVRQGFSCRPDGTVRKDHTLEVLSVLHQLVGLNKSATDIRPTPTVNVLP